LDDHLASAPETLAFEEVVCHDEVTIENRKAMEDQVAWLKRQSSAVQEGALGGRKKRGPLERGLLTENHITTPSAILTERYPR